MIITICNRKGGVGKTTTAVNLAHGLAIKGHPTIIVDADHQGHVSPALGLSQGQDFKLMCIWHDSAEKYLCAARGMALRMIRGNQSTLDVPHIIMEGKPLPSDPEKRDRFVAEGKDPLTKALRRLDHHAEYVIIDTNHSSDLITPICIMAADAVLIPVAVDHLSLLGLDEQILYLSRMSAYRDIKILGILPTFYDEVTKESRHNLSSLTSNTARGVLLGEVHRATAFRECAAYGKTIFEHRKETREVLEYARLVKRVEAYKTDWLAEERRLRHEARRMALSTQDQRGGTDAG